MLQITSQTYPCHMDLFSMLGNLILLLVQKPTEYFRNILNYYNNNMSLYVPHSCFQNYFFNVFDAYARLRTHIQVQFLRGLGVCGTTFWSNIGYEIGLQNLCFKEPKKKPHMSKLFLLERYRSYLYFSGDFPLSLIAGRSYSNRKSKNLLKFNDKFETYTFRSC